MRLIDADAFDKCLEGAEIEATKNRKYVLSSAINTIRGNLANFPNVNQWIPCSERLPEEDGEYLVESTRGYEVLYYREEEKQFGLMVFNFAGKVEFVPKKVYEWMPIPGVEE